jgi:hypothetical protein
LQTMQTLKSLFVTLLIIGGAFLAYDRYLAPEKDKIVFKNRAAGTETAVPPPAPTVNPVPSAVETPTAPAAPVSAPPVASMPESGSVSMTAPSSAPAPAPAPADDGFVPPRIPSVEDATMNWMRIPATAFPRAVKLSKPATFKAGFGSTQVGAGATVTVIAAQQGTLTIAPNAASTLRSTVPIDATDLKATLAQVYETWRTGRIAEARRAWEKRDATPATPAAVQVAAFDSSGKPERDADGRFPLLLASMKSGAVTEITPQSITRWGNPEKDESSGKPAWIVPIEYDAVTAFGKFSTEAIAKIAEGRVIGWYYKGSGEVVP